VRTIAFFENRDFQDAFERVLGGAFRGAADAGEVLATAARVRDGDADSWVREWTATAGTAWAAGGAALRAGHRVSARSHFLRAGGYYDTALRLVTFSTEPERQLVLWRRQRECWDHAIALFDPPAERLAIPYEDTVLPGYFFRAPGAAPGERRPLVVLNNGSDAATSRMWVLGGAAAAERGLHWMTFDGPGQQAALFEQGLRFRPDWEAVLTPVADALLTRPDVDPDRVAVIGVGLGGFLMPRALAFEHRFAAAVADPGVVDVSTSWTDPLPDELHALLRAGELAAFDREMHLTELFAPGAATLLHTRAAPYGLDGGSRAALFKTLAGFRLGDEVERIRTPLLVTDADGEPFWPGQARALVDRLRGSRALVRFTAEEGAGGHCAPLAPAVRDSRIFDWLEERLRSDVDQNP
jgi:Prolyl oligopeptidase family